MSDYEMKWVGGKQYIAGPEGQKVWVVSKHWPGGASFRVASYFSEALARAHVGDIAGRDETKIGLEAIDVLDICPNRRS